MSNWEMLHSKLAVSFKTIVLFKNYKKQQNTFFGYKKRSILIWR